MEAEHLGFERYFGFRNIEKHLFFIGFRLISGFNWPSATPTRPVGRVSLIKKSMNAANFNEINKFQNIFKQFKEMSKLS